MSLHYHVKYECQKTGVDLKYVLSLMINHKIAQLSILVVMNYFVTIQFAGERIFVIGEHLVKLQAKMFDRVIRPICLRLLSSEMQNSPDK